MARERGDPERKSLQRVPSGIPGLDEILDGGFLSGGIYIIQGPPGAGKTIFGNQISFSHAARGGRVLYVTLLAENHARMMAHLDGMGFYRPDFMPRALYFIGGFNVLEAEGLQGLLTLLRREVQGRDASLLVLDGLVAVEHSASSELDYKKFIHELQTLAGFAECTMFLLTSARGLVVTPEHTMVDGLIDLSEDQYGVRALRELIVRKFRGSYSLGGRHPFRIDAGGITVYPRTESRLARLARPDDVSTERMTSGVPGLDAMMMGGLPAGSMTLVLGPSGGGKTTFGLEFLADSSAAEPGLLFGFFETPKRLVAKAELLGLSLRGLVENGAVEIIHVPQIEDILEAAADRLLAAARRRKVKRLVIDGMRGFQHIAVRPERLSSFFAALTSELRALGITTLVTLEVPELVGPVVRAPVLDVSPICDNMVMLRYVELRSRLYRLVSILKLRDSDFDATLREFTINSKGIEVAQSFESAEAILTGLAHVVPPREPIADSRSADPKAGKPPGAD
ncbi:MAG: recombinase RecA [Alphaproteobacteria bacterium]|nr:recombinase RecA [Alphaproteobacteria bacterium]